MTFVTITRVMSEMYVPARDAFYRAIRQLQLPSSSTVVVGLSGGADSVALTYLARQAFKGVVTVTVDHRLREESTEEAGRVGEIARSLGAEHHIVSLEWGKEGRGYRTAARGRFMCYSALMEQCRQRGVNVLMVGHHANDQIETMLCRVMNGSGIVGLGGMHLVSHWAAHPNLSIVRPLLECSKSSLIQLCREQGLEWVEDPSNQKPISPRNQIRPIMTRYPELAAGLGDLMALCREAQEFSRPDIKDAMQRLAFVSRKYGTISFDALAYKALNPYIARNILAIWIRYIGSTGNAIKRYGLEKLHRAVLDDRPADTQNSCILFSLPNEGRFMIAKESPKRRLRRKTPIKVGETVLWDNRFTIHLFVSKTGQEDRGALYEAELKSREFFVRHFIVSDNHYMMKGIRKVKGNVLLPRNARGGLPVIVDSEDNVVLIPHFKVINYAVGVDCSVEFTPQWSMAQLLNFSYIDQATGDSTPPVDS